MPVPFLRAGQFGPNATTWLLPGEVFPTDIRATCHGISAAVGKVGGFAATLKSPKPRSWTVLMHPVLRLPLLAMHRPRFHQASTGLGRL